MSHYTGSVPASEPAGQWVKQGACKDDPDAMFPGTLAAEIENAKAVCRRCPVVQECGQWALETREASGVWGGMSEADRRNLLRRRGRGTGRAPKPEQEPEQAKEPRPPRKPAECGTRSGYHKHYREKTPYCAPCRAANTAANRRLTATGTTRIAV